MSDTQAWEKQPGENVKAYHAFCHYRDLPPAERSIKRAMNDHRKTCQGKSGDREASGRWEHWSRTFGWTDRASIHDAHVDKLLREKLTKDRIDTAARHARLAQGTLQVMATPIRAFIASLANPAVSLSA